jgi:hypothetical protein
MSVDWCACKLPSDFGQFRTCLSLDGQESAWVPFSRPVIGVESEEMRNRFPKSPRHSFKLFERRCIPSAFNQTQEIHGDANNLGKFLLRLIRFITNLANAESELFL